ncbi:hypothetical protein Fcan01_27376 [Folsomia candida]|uniref:Uncharacterized protein n=1 Tax=Folsomia candida TaxID=158441 RepID=A0A226CYL7_FOLCA|nr:hypothetical protein Fcan01_27376 [Folsomia candida]
MEPPYIYIFDACASIYFDNYLFEHKFPLGWDAKRRRVFFRNSSGNLDKHLTPVIFSVLCAMMWVCVLLVLNTSYQPYPEFSRLAFTSAVTMFSGFFAYGGMIYNEIVRKRYEAVFGNYLKVGTRSSLEYQKGRVFSRVLHLLMYGYYKFAPFMAFAIVWFEFEPTIHLFRIFGEIFPQIFYPRPDWILAIRLTQLIFRFILYWWLILELVRIFMAGATFYCSVAQVAHRIIAIIDELTNRYGPCARQIQNYRVFRIIMTILNDMSNLAGFLTCFGLIIICCSSNYMIIANFSLFPVWLLLIFICRSMDDRWDEVSGDGGNSGAAPQAGFHAMSIVVRFWPSVVHRISVGMIWTSATPTSKSVPDIVPPEASGRVGLAP